jgi:1-deoxy-D-xylulose-5-phosphate reductoisomerase
VSALPVTGAAPRDVVVLGSTGSIGRQALEVIAAHPQRFRVKALCGRRNSDLLIEQARAFRPEHVGVEDRSAARAVRAALGRDVDVLDGTRAATELAGSAGNAGIVLNGLVGSLGLRPTLAALAAGSRLALANKESLIVGGALVLSAAAAGQVVPVDSEHSALAQCLRAGSQREVARLVVTASGGPFRGRSRRELRGVGVAEALAHPTWSMGSVITINSATLANKGLEVIEAHLLFDIAYDRIEVVVHPQSIVHGMVEFVDGATIAKLSPPDMRLPIQLALGWPERLDSPPARMDWTRAQQLTFEPVDTATFPMLGLATAAGRAGGSAPAVFNAANEEAVDAFLDGRLTFLGIAAVVEAVLEEHEPGPATDLDTVLAAEARARARAREQIVRLADTER